MLETVNTPAIAFLFGLVTSLHCVGMCGPIACSLSTLKGGETQQMTSAVCYHGGRLLSYSLIGATFGAIGMKPLQWFFNSPAVLLPWALVIMFFLIALGLEKKIPRPAFFNRFVARARFKAAKTSVTRGSLAMGLFTPLLPCGPLYMLFGFSLLTGSAIRGAEFALAFGLGTVPLLWLAQHAFHKIQAQVKAATMPLIRRGLALVTAILMSMRLADTLPWNQAQAENTPSSQLENTLPPAENDQSNGENSAAEKAEEVKQALPSCCH